MVRDGICGVSVDELKNCCSHFKPVMGQREAAEARTAAAARDFQGSGSGRGSGVAKTKGRGSGRGSDVIIAAGRAAIIIATKELSFEPNRQSVGLFIKKLS